MAFFRKLLTFAPEDNSLNLAHAPNSGLAPARLLESQRDGFSDGQSVSRLSLRDGILVRQRIPDLGFSSVRSGISARQDGHPSHVSSSVRCDISASLKPNIFRPVLLHNK